MTAPKLTAEELAALEAWTRRYARVYMGMPESEFLLQPDAERVQRLLAEHAELTKRAEKAEANYSFMVERVADEKLDGYRELGARAAKAENDADALRRRVAELEDANEMACEEPSPRCECAGCCVARKRFTGSPYP